jgi:hypothetical protein
MRVRQTIERPQPPRVREELSRLLLYKFDEVWKLPCRVFEPDRLHVRELVRTVVGAGLSHEVHHLPRTVKLVTAPAHTTALARLGGRVYG